MHAPDSSLVSQRSNLNSYNLKTMLTKTLLFIVLSLKWVGGRRETTIVRTCNACFKHMTENLSMLTEVSLNKTTSEEKIIFLKKKRVLFYKLLYLIKTIQRLLRQSEIKWSVPCSTNITKWLDFKLRSLTLVFVLEQNHP